MMGILYWHFNRFNIHLQIHDTRTLALCDLQVYETGLISVVLIYLPQLQAQHFKRYNIKLLFLSHILFKQYGILKIDLLKSQANWGLTKTTLYILSSSLMNWHICTCCLSLCKWLANTMAMKVNRKALTIQQCVSFCPNLDSCNSLSQGQTQ